MVFFFNTYTELILIALIGYCFTPYVNISAIYRRPEKRWEKGIEKNQSFKLTRVSIPYQRVLVHYYLVQYKDFMEDINPSRQILLLEHFILLISYFICRVIRVLTASLFTQDPSKKKVFLANELRICILINLITTEGFKVS